MVLSTIKNAKGGIMKDNKFEFAVDVIRNNIIHVYDGTDTDDLPMINMMDMLIESILLLARVINERPIDRC